MDKMKKWGLEEINQHIEYHYAEIEKWIESEDIDSCRRHLGAIKLLKEVS